MHAANKFKNETKMLMSPLGHHIRVCDDLFVYVKADLHFATSLCDRYFATDFPFEICAV